MLGRVVSCLQRPAFALGGDNRIIAWNQRLEALLGHPSSSAIGSRCWDLLRGLNEQGVRRCGPGCATLQQRDRGQEIVPFVMDASCSDGSRRRLECSASPVRASGQRPALLYQLRPVPNEGAGNRTALARAALTPRENAVLRLLGEGLDTRALAATLGIREVTVRNHVQNLLRKLAVGSRLAAVARARKLGLL